MPDEDAEPDRYELRPDGGVNMWMTGKRVKLRHPRLREYRKMVGLFYDTADKSGDDARAEIAWVTARTEERGGRENFTPDDFVEERKQARQFQDLLIDGWIAWGTALVETLGTEGEVPKEEDDLPVFFATQDYAVAIINHWRTVPSPSGAR